MIFLFLMITSSYLITMLQIYNFVMILPFLNEASKIQISHAKQKNRLNVNDIAS